MSEKRKKADIVPDNYDIYPENFRKSIEIAIEDLYKQILSEPTGKQYKYLWVILAGFDVQWQLIFFGYDPLCHCGKRIYRLTPDLSGDKAQIELIADLVL